MRARACVLTCLGLLVFDVEGQREDTVRPAGVRACACARAWRVRVRVRVCACGVRACVRICRLHVR